MNAVEPKAERRPGKAPACPGCGSDDVVRVVYGYPGEELAKSGRYNVASGGCVIGQGSPSWRCRACECEFQPDAPD